MLMSGLVGGTIYSFSVRACNSVGCSGDSAPVEAQTTPSAPTALTLTAGIAKITASWVVSTSSGVTEHQLWYRANNSASWIEWTPGESDSPGTVVTGLANSLTYALKVRAVASYGFTDSASALATPLGVPSPPSLSYFNIKADGLILSWSMASTSP
jgi:cellulose 1,4-beta-cellobiosidase